MPPTADLSIASKYAYYNNRKPHGESLKVVLYIHNAGPDSAASPVVTTGYNTPMDHDKWQASGRLARISPQLLKQGLADSNTLWVDSEIVKRDEDHEKMLTATTLPIMDAETVFELSLSFPVTHQTSHTDDTLNASVYSSTTDPRLENNSTSYIVTSNHDEDGEEYWQSPGNLANLD
ncbi:nuclease [Beauveria brongniartii RCEF 3172]|uniref:Nuclease n=1 Tax=Beauveria brongniartii RCEF 3172 TaxID=1081107 RepID=A0A166VP48_9HYPO|nr:nuclease [Beauveria brongniartii RCEF 3172]